MGKYCFGIDVGGTTVKLGLFDLAGNILDKWEIPSNTSNGGEAILPDTAKAVMDKLQEKNIDSSEVVGIGIGTPGPVDAQGTVYNAVNLGWGTFNIPETLEKLVQIPVKAGNDANVAAMGEMWKGGGHGRSNIIAITLGTGVGGGIIVNGKMLTGALGAAGEIGHIHVEDNEETMCNCKCYGCLEQYVSATGLVRLGKRKLQEETIDSILRQEDVTAKTIFDAVKKGDQLAIMVAEEFGDYLGKALSVVAGVVNPEVFVIGGGVSKAGSVLLEYIQKYFIKYVFPGCANAEFTLATLGNDAGIYGAARLVLE